VSFVLFLLASLGIASRVNLVAAGLAVYMASQLVGVWVR
jgi:hypothetical protein